ncbi:Aste57867_6036 [Aphanomyces stellatus]|uniref:Poly [ADP-ribose] polymerase n=1 Tax=Aphanomyces stellatus TaxID=120398 RepID=A0A485KF24_9STRA|nr:hypothetical protein As57867_006022 [Aphanomyces stellatus]VFT83049.1 Aste57867_6036 [Aphanomyces stellatus]
MDQGVVDPLSGMEETGTVLQEGDGTVWSVMLNQTDVSYGVKGHNKFYSFQIIIDNNDGYRAFVFFRWGRVGAKNPQRKLHGPYTKDAAKELFVSKFTLKTENEWPLQGAFEPVKGKYTLIELDYTEDDDDDETPAANLVDAKDVPPSKLPQSIQDFIKMICDVDLIAQEVAEMHLDLKRMPLGKLSKQQLAKGYGILDDISETLGKLSELQNKKEEPQEPAPSGNTTRARRSTRIKTTSTNKTAIAKCKALLKEYSSDFYTLVPHDFGMHLPPVIDTMSELKQKLDLLEVLSDIEITQKMIKTQHKERDVNPVDARYGALGMTMEEVSQSSSEFKNIQEYIALTHAPTHRQYKLRVDAIHKLHWPSDESKNAIFDSIDNHQLLWHGSRLSNIASILTKGLRIAPPEAPSTGYMFGKGIYFADVASKSANYCWASAKQTKGVLILSEVALGKCTEVLEADEYSFESLEAMQCQSLLGLGRMTPDKESHLISDAGVKMPKGTLTPTSAEGTLLYNEYVVYRTEQVKMRYAVTLHFEFH